VGECPVSGALSKVGIDTKAGSASKGAAAGETSTTGKTNPKMGKSMLAGLEEEEMKQQPQSRTIEQQVQYVNSDVFVTKSWE